MRAAAHWRAALAGVLLAGCTTLEKPPPAFEPEPTPPAAIQPPPPAPAPKREPARVSPPEPPPALRALQFFDQLQERPEHEQRQEQERLRKSFASSRSDHDRIRLALALGMPGSSRAEEEQALQLLEPLVRDARNDYHDLASLLTALLSEQRRRAEQALALQIKLERIKALEREMQERATAREPRSR